MNTFHTQDFDTELGYLDIYDRYPELLPFVGKDFKSMEQKVLMLGESHYLPEKSTIHNDAMNWYNDNSTSLSEEEKDWLNTRNAINARSGQRLVNKAYTIHHNLEKSIMNAGFYPDENDNLFRYFVYYNYFLRPAQTGISIDRKHIDKEKSFYHLNVIIDYLKIDIVIFSSVMAYKDFNWFYETYNCLTQAKIYCVPHASSSHWNKEVKKYQNENGSSLTGREYFESILRRHEISQPR